MKNGTYIILGIILLFIAMYAFASVMVYFDKRQAKKKKSKDIEKQIFKSYNQLDEKILTSQQPKAHSRKNNKIKDKAGSKN
ncbi:hypothetical protein FJ651_03310 [Paucihalobacter ruber]|uniref:Uncharacterized protein n=1 Tax=Paucihalobacter ruber TaxID=2567861 RepID=A0A506PQN4_9FLAO|nr:hypothetical protein [Paucihalobacter ruber]TPV35961.1 hypothetical protein FJ651_03310 [Paucihalobacter ruber]